MHTLIGAQQQAQDVLDRLRNCAEAAGCEDHCGVLTGTAEDAPIGVVMCLADQCGVNYRELFSDL